jgi:multidrug resistance efflux pump
MQIFNVLFRLPQQNLADRQRLAQAKVAQLQRDLNFVSKSSRNSTANLQSIKSKLQSELRFWETELKQAEATLAQPICSGAGGGLGGLLVRSFRVRQSGLPP